MLPDYYALLGLSRCATEDDIRRARRKLLKRYHPDARGGSTSSAREILVAADVLLDSATRAEYEADFFGAALPHVPLADAPRDLTCTACGHASRQTTRHWCAWCGAGIGATPRPVQRVPLPVEMAGRRALVDAVAGAMAGALVGLIGILAVDTRWDVPDGSYARAWLFAVLIGALAGWRFGGRIWHALGQHLAPQRTRSTRARRALVRAAARRRASGPSS